MKRTLEQWIADETIEQEHELWGKIRVFAPQLCSTVFGDGKQLIWISAIGSRPFYWLMLIDSKTDISSNKFYIEEYLEALDDDFRLYQWISEEEFLEAKENGEYKEIDTYEEYDKKVDEYPNFEWDGGSWGVIVNMKNKLKV